MIQTAEERPAARPSTADDHARDQLRRVTLEADQLRAEVRRWKSIAFVIALEIDSGSPEYAERSLRSIARREADAEQALYVRAADVVRDAHADRDARRRAELNALRAEQSPEVAR